MSRDHTPTPWKVVQRPNFGNGYIYTSIQPVTPDPETMRHMLMASGEYYICDTIHTPVASKAEKYLANAEFIVTAVNAYHSNQSEIARLRECLSAIKSMMGNVDHSRGGGENTARLYGGMLESIRELASQALSENGRG